MKFFAIQISKFLIIPIVCIVLLLFVNSEVESKRALLNNAPENYNIIIMGDSKSVVDFDYTIFKTRFPEYNIINISNWANNPLNNYLAFKDILEQKRISNSIFIYNSTFRHLLNRNSKSFGRWKFKEKVDALLKNSYKFKHTKSKNGFINVLKHDFRDKKSGIAFYKSLEDKYNADFTSQINYIIKLEDLVRKGNNNKFFVCELPHDSVIANIYKNSNYYSIYKNAIKTQFNSDRLYFNHLQHLDDRKYWFDHNHLHDLGTKEFTPQFCDSLMIMLKL